MNFLSRLCLVGSLLSSGCAFAAAEQISCPATVSVVQQISAPAPGWKVAAEDLPHRLASITFFDGPPEENASLVYDSYVKLAGKEIGKWRFGATAGKAQWISCSYSGTSITLSKSLPAGVTFCSVTYNPRQQVSGLPLIEQVICK